MANITRPVAVRDPKLWLKKVYPCQGNLQVYLSLHEKVTNPETHRTQKVWIYRLIGRNVKVTHAANPMVSDCVFDTLSNSITTVISCPPDEAIKPEQIPHFREQIIHKNYIPVQFVAYIPVANLQSRMKPFCPGTQLQRFIDCKFNRKPKMFQERIASVLVLNFRMEPFCPGTQLQRFIDCKFNRKPKMFQDRIASVLVLNFRMEPFCPGTQLQRFIDCKFNRKPKMFQERIASVLVLNFRSQFPRVNKPYFLLSPIRYRVKLASTREASWWLLIDWFEQREGKTSYSVNISRGLASRIL